MKHVTIHTAVSGAYHHLMHLQIVGAHRFPERQGHPDDAIALVVSDLRSRDVVDVITAYADIIDFVGEAIYEKLITGLVKLYHPDGTITEHQFDEEGCLVDWPVGCLMADHEPHIFELKRAVGLI